MTFELIRNFLAACLIPVLLISCQTVTQHVHENEKDENEVYGQWIQYRGGANFQIKTVSKKREINEFYNEFGTLRRKRVSDISIESNDDEGSTSIKTIIEPKAEWQYLAGGKKPQGLKWTTTDFDSSQANWKTGRAGFGYADDDDETVLEDMLNKYTAVYIRKEFEITNNTDLSRLALAINYDDGFVLYLNGRYVFSINVTNEEGTITVSNHEASGIEYFPLVAFADALNKGKNVIGIEGHNATIDSSDFSLDPHLVVGGGYTNFIKRNSSDKLYDIRGKFSEEKGVEGDNEGGYMITDGVLRESQMPKDGNSNSQSGAFHRTSEPGHALLIAAQEGNTRKIDALLKAGTPVDFTTQHSYTPLAYAAAGGHLRSASLLLKNGADINKQSRWDKSPLLLVAGSNNIKSADFLLKNGADINAVQNWKATCVHETIWWKQPKNLKYFLKKGLSPNTVDGNGHSPLHWAVWGANPNNEDSLAKVKTLIDILLEAGVNKSLKNNAGKTAYDLAVEKDLKQIALTIKP